MHFRVINLASWDLNLFFFFSHVIYAYGYFLELMAFKALVVVVVVVVVAAVLLVKN